MTRVSGPAIVEERDATVIVPRHWRMTVGAGSNLVLDFATDAARRGAVMATTPQTITAEILRHALVVAAEEASIVVVRSAYSTFIVEGSDASAAIFDVAGRLIAQSTATSLAHMASLRLCVRTIIEDFPPAAMADGDIYVMNDSYRGGIHANDLAVIQPVFVGGHVSYFTGTLIHVSDVGGSSAGGMHATATDIFQEGLQLPPVKLADKGGLRADIARIIGLNSRSPESVIGDIHALMAGTTVARRRLEALVDEHGAAGLSAGIEQYLAYAERLARREVARLTPGTYRGSYQIDNDGIDLERSHHIEVAVTVSAGGVIVDFDRHLPPGGGGHQLLHVADDLRRHLRRPLLPRPDHPDERRLSRPLRDPGAAGNAAQPDPSRSHRRPLRRPLRRHRRHHPGAVAGPTRSRRGRLGHPDALHDRVGHGAALGAHDLRLRRRRRPPRQ